MKNQLQLKQSQKLLLTPQLRQSIQLLNMSTLERDEWLSDVLVENPLLERLVNVEAMQKPITASVSSLHVSESEFDPWLYVEDTVDFRRYLLGQICEHPLSDDEAFAVGVLIESLNEHGYLTSSLEDIADHAPLEWLLDEERLQSALLQLQSFDPAGVGAKDIAESLQLQLLRLPHSCEQQVALRIVLEFLPEMGRASFDKKIGKACQVDEDCVQKALQLLSSLNPYPSNGFESNEFTQYIEPDVEVVFKEGHWQVLDSFLGGLPIKINEEYAGIAVQNSNEAMLQLLKDAQSLIQQLNLRSQTIKMVSEYIVMHQQAFFSEGRVALKPMSMADVAKALSLHESTISRAVNKKYLNCPQGLLELRSFFSQAVGNDGNEDASAIAIKALIERYIKDENKQKPYSDDAIVKWLAGQDIQIARRTVSKYREALGIPAAFARKIKC